MMKEQIKKMREENGGFTLAELLIVVAIIAVLVAIAIPVFTSALHNSKAAADEANCRAVYADLQADYLANADKTYTEPDWAKANTGNTYKFSDGQTGELSTGTITVTFSEGTGYKVVYDCSEDDTHDHTWGA